MNYILFLVVCVICFYLYIILAEKLNIIDKPNERSSHKSIVIRGLGGVFPVLILFGYQMFDLENYYLLISLFISGIVGFLDDLYSLKRSIRLLSYLVATILCIAGLYLNFTLSNIPILLIIVVLFLGTVNAYNFMDGINGMTIFYSLTFFLTVVILKELIFLEFISNDLLYLFIILMISSSIFNVRKKALAFLGDAGSITLGFVICFFVLSIIISTNNINWIVLLAVYGVDSVGTIIFRLYRRENIFNAHRLHIYQILANEKQYGHLKVSIIYAVLQGIINSILIYLTNIKLDSTIYILGVFLTLTTLYFFLRKFYMKDFHLR